MFSASRRSRWLTWSGWLSLPFALAWPMLLPYPLFVLAYRRGWRWPGKASGPVALLFSTLASTLLMEAGSWLSEFMRNSPHPALLHPQLFPDLITSVGFYLAWWAAWAWLLSHYRFHIGQVFVTMGLYGVLIEQQGQIFLAGLASLPWGVGLWLLVFVVYGATMALAVTLVHDRFTPSRDTSWKYPLAWLGLFGMTVITSLSWGWLLGRLALLPPPKLPMRAFPWW